MSRLLPRLFLLAGLLGIASGEESARLEVVSPEEGAALGRGDRMIVWRSQAGGSVLLSVSLDAGLSWTDLAERPASDGVWFWDPKGLPDGSCVHLRLQLKDADGKVRASVSRTLLVDFTPPRVRIAGPAKAEDACVPLQVEHSDAASGVASLSVWATEDGKTWAPAVAAADPSSPLVWTAPHRGRWGLVAMGRDRAGNEGPRPGEGTEPQLWLQVLTPEPWIGRFDLEVSGRVLRPGDPVTVSWDVEGDGRERIRLERRGAREAWEVLAEGLPARGKSASFVWKAPAEQGPLPELRLVAQAPDGTRGVREIWPSAWVDGEPPAVSLSAPALWEKASSVELEARVTDSPSGVRRSILWGLRPGGAAWERLGEFGPLDPVSFLPAGDGCWGLWLQAEDMLGNASAAPRAGTGPMASVLVDRASPRVVLRAPRGGEVLASGGHLKVSWKATDASLPERPAALFSSRDAGASWELQADGLPPEGDLEWEAPRAAGPLWLRLVVQDAAGHRGEARLERPVALLEGEPRTPPPPPEPEEPEPPPSTPPEVVHEPSPPPPPVEASRPPPPRLLTLPGTVQGGRPLALCWAPPAAPEGLEVEASASVDGGRTWKPVARASADSGSLDWAVPLADWPDLRLRLTLWRGKTDLGSSPERRITVASRPPKVRLVPLPAPASP